MHFDNGAPAPASSSENAGFASAGIPPAPSTDGEETVELEDETASILSTCDINANTNKDFAKEVYELLKGCDLLKSKDALDIRRELEDLAHQNVRGAQKEWHKIGLLDFIARVKHVKKTEDPKNKREQEIAKFKEEIGDNWAFLGERTKKAKDLVRLNYNRLRQTCEEQKRKFEAMEAFPVVLDLDTNPFMDMSMVFGNEEAELSVIKHALKLEQDSTVLSRLYMLMAGRVFMYQRFYNRTPAQLNSYNKWLTANNISLRKVQRYRKFAGFFACIPSILFVDNYSDIIDRAEGIVARILSDINQDDEATKANEKLLRTPLPQINIIAKKTDEVTGHTEQITKMIPVIYPAPIECLPIYIGSKAGPHLFDDATFEEFEKIMAPLSDKDLNTKSKPFKFAEHTIDDVQRQAIAGMTQFLTSNEYEEGIQHPPQGDQGLNPEHVQMEQADFGPPTIAIITNRAECCVHCRLTMMGKLIGYGPRTLSGPKEHTIGSLLNALSNCFGFVPRHDPKQVTYHICRENFTTPYVQQNVPHEATLQALQFHMQKESWVQIDLAKLEGGAEPYELKSYADRKKDIQFQLRRYQAWLDEGELDEEPRRRSNARKAVHSNVAPIVATPTTAS